MMREFFWREDRISNPEKGLSNSLLHYDINCDIYYTPDDNILYIAYCWETMKLVACNEFPVSTFLRTHSRFGQWARVARAASSPFSTPRGR